MYSLIIQHMGLITDKIMSCFTTPAIMEMLGHYRWRVYEPFRFYLSEDKNDVIEVPVGFIIVLATVPRIFWSLLPPDGEYAKAAIIHDYLYHYSLRDRKESDLIFLDGMTVLGVPKWKRTLMYLAVRMFGWKYYDPHRLTLRLTLNGWVLKKHEKLPLFKIAIMILNGFTISSTVTQTVLIHPSQTAILQINEN